MSAMEPYSEAAREKLRLINEKEARGEKIGWSDIAGIWEPNPDLPDCQRWEDAEVQCELPNHHDGPHKAVITW